MASYKLTRLHKKSTELSGLSTTNDSYRYWRGSATVSLPSPPKLIIFVNPYGTSSIMHIDWIVGIGDLNATYSSGAIFTANTGSSLTVGAKSIGYLTMSISGNTITITPDSSNPIYSSASSSTGYMEFTFLY